MKVIIIHVRATQRDRQKESEREWRKYVSVSETLREIIYVIAFAGPSWFGVGAAMLFASKKFFLNYLSDMTIDFNRMRAEAPGPSKP